MTDPHHYDPTIHHRRSIRLAGYDYSQQGMYFITICAHRHRCLFGTIVDGIIQLNQYGKIVGDEWEKSARIRAEIELGPYVIMPNHFHAIVMITGRGDRPVAPTTPVAPIGPKPKSIGSLIAGFKSVVTKRINILRSAPGKPVWQRNYWEHIIRNEKSFDQIAAYIINNPVNWKMDKLHDGEN